MSVRYWPSYFREKDEAYTDEPRKVWLETRIKEADTALQQYKDEITLIANEAAKLDGKSDIASWISTAGGVALAIPGVVTQIVGGVALIGGAVWNIFERKADNEEIKKMAEQVRQYTIEYNAVNSYREAYSKELTRLRLTPILIFVIVIIIFFL